MKMIFSILFSSLLIGCAGAPRSPSNYDADNSMRAAETHFGRVLDVRKVTIQRGSSSNSTMGSVIGGTIGGAAGAGVSPKSPYIGGMVGAAGGAIAGDAISRSFNSVDGYEIIVRFHNRQVRAIAQEGDVRVHPGQCVAVLVSGNGQARVVPSSACDS